NTGKFRTDANRMRMETNEFHLRTPEEMYAAFEGTFTGHEQALGQSQAIADTVDIDLELGKRHFPSFEVPQGKRAIEYLRELCLTGLRERYAKDPERWEHLVGGDSCRPTDAVEGGEGGSAVPRQELAPTALGVGGESLRRPEVPLTSDPSAKGFASHTLRQ